MYESKVTPKKQKDLDTRLQELKIKEEDLQEKFIKGSGHGGQKLNKTASCVHLKHTPSNIEIKCQETRSRALNRYYARKRLCDELEKKLLGKESPQEKKAAKIRKQKKRRLRRCTDIR